MSRIWQKLRPVAGGFAAGGIVVGSLVLYSTGFLLPNLARIGWLFASIIVLVFFTGLTVFLAARLARASRGMKGYLHWPMLGWFGLSTVATLVVLAIITDWEFIGAPIRSMMSGLPQGNLLEAGGRLGATYLGLFVLLAAALFINKKSIDWMKKTLTSSRKKYKRGEIPSRNSDDPVS